MVIKHGKKAQQERSGHVSLPRVNCHKQVLLLNYSMTCCPALLCQSQAQDWLSPPACDQYNVTSQFPCSHTDQSLLPLCSQFYYSRLCSPSSRVDLTHSRKHLIYALQNSSRSAHSKKAPAEPEPAPTAEVAHTPRVSHTTHCLWESSEIHRIWICFEGFPGGQQKLPRHICGFPQPCLPESSQLRFTGR